MLEVINKKAGFKFKYKLIPANKSFEDWLFSDIDTAKTRNHSYWRKWLF